MSDTTDAMPAAVATPTTALITLSEPIARTGGDVAVLTLRKPRAGELRGLKVPDLATGDVDAILRVLPRIATPFITDAEAANLAADDLAQIAGNMIGFFMSQAEKAQMAAMMGN